MSKPIWEATSAGGSYRVTVERRTRDGLLQVELWKWHATDGPDGRSYHYWSPFSTSSIVDSEETARRVAKQRLEAISGEPLNLTPDPPTIEWIREHSGDSSAEFVDVNSVVVRTEATTLYPLRIVRLSDLFLVQESADPHEWWMGSEAVPGIIACWGVYGDLASAIASR